MKRIAILASGSGSNAENIVNYFAGKGEVEIPFIMSNNKSAFVHERAARLGVPSVTFGRDKLESGEVLAYLREQKIDFVVLAGYMLKIPDDMLAAYPDRIVNIHPSLLPKYGGRGMHGDHVHEAVVAAHETESGITIHYLNDRYDEGSVVFQAKCEVLPTDTPHDVATKVHALEYAHFPHVIEELVMAL